jgi:hypothetical protein
MDKVMETESLVWPPPVSDGTIVWLVAETAPNAEPPERSAGHAEHAAARHGEARDHGASIDGFDAPVTTDLECFQAEETAWKSGVNETPASAAAALRSPAPAFRTPARKGAFATYGPLAAAAIGTVIALAGSWTLNHRQASGYLTTADLAERPQPVPTTGVVRRPVEEPVAIPIRQPEPVTIASPVADPGIESPAAETPTGIRLAPPRVDRPRDAVIPAPARPLVPAQVNRPSSVATLSSSFLPGAIASAPAPVAAAIPLPSISAPIPALQPSYVSRPSVSETTVAPAKPPVDDQFLVTQALQRYRLAYNELDARSARAVWPGVNEAALARAFQALESQKLTFETCDVQLHTAKATATATCRGAARYVPKIGNRDPHTESRVWHFDLRKDGDAWMIDGALVAR